jgi:hypothetical protein
MGTVKVRVLRAFYYERKLLDVKSEAMLPKGFAAEVVASAKAEYVVDVPAQEIAKDATNTEAKRARN